MPYRQKLSSRTQIRDDTCSALLHYLNVVLVLHVSFAVLLNGKKQSAV